MDITRVKFKYLFYFLELFFHLRVKSWLWQILYQKKKKNLYQGLNKRAANPPGGGGGGGVERRDVMMDF